MSLIDLGEVLTKVSLASREWRGYVINAEDPAKLGRVQVAVARIIDNGAGSYEKSESDADPGAGYPWATPKDPKNLRIPDYGDEVSLTFPTGDPYDVQYGPPMVTDSSLPHIENAFTVKMWNTFLQMLRAYREEGVDAPPLEPKEEDENEEPLFDPHLLADVVKEIDPVIPPKENAQWKVPELEGFESSPEYPIKRPIDEGYPEISLKATKDAFHKENRKAGSVQGVFHGPSGSAYHMDRYGNLTVQVPRIDINPCPEYGGPEETDRKVQFMPKKGKRVINGGNYVSADTYVNGYPVVLGGGAGGGFWHPRPVELFEYPPNDRPEETDPYAFKVHVSHVNGQHLPANRDEIFVLEDGDAKKVWLEVTVSGNRTVEEVNLVMGDEMPLSPVEIEADYVSPFANYLLFSVSADEKGVDYDTLQQYVHGPISFLFSSHDIGNAGTFFNAVFISG